MQSEVKEVSPFERLLSFHVAAVELEDAMDTAALKLSKQMKIKGFRPGKAPRTLVERMVGVDAVRREAVDASLGGFVSAAISETDLVPATAPRVEALRDSDDGGVEVEVRITLWPTVSEPPDFSGRTLEVEVPDVDEEEVDQQVDRLRNQFAELEDVSREAHDGDFVLINLTAHGARGEIEEAAASDFLYEIGSHSFVPGLDEMLSATSAGDIREGKGQLPAGFVGDEAMDVTLKVLVKGVRVKKLPDVADDWVSDVTEFDTVFELREQLEKSLFLMKMNAVAAAFQEQLVEELVAELDVELPDAIIEAEMETTLRNLSHSLKEQGVNLEDFLKATGQDQATFVDDLRTRATRVLRTHILLETVANAEGIEIEDGEMDEAIAALALQSGQDEDEIRVALDSSGRRLVLAGDILRRKALDRLLEEATAVDVDGNLVVLDVSATGDQDDQIDNRDTEGKATADEDITLQADNVSDAE